MPIICKLSGGGTDPNLIPSNIKSGVTISNVLGTFDRQTGFSYQGPNNTVNVPANGKTVYLRSHTVSSGTNAAGAYNWSFKGWNGTSWITLASGSQWAAQSAGTPYETSQSYTIANNTTYTQVRFEFSPSSLNWDRTIFTVAWCY